MLLLLTGYGHSEEQPQSGQAWTRQIVFAVSGAVQINRQLHL
jgi:hypothetical protein